MSKTPMLISPVLHCVLPVTRAGRMAVRIVVWLLLAAVFTAGSSNLVRALDCCEEEGAVQLDHAAESICPDCKHFTCACQLSLPAPVLVAVFQCALPASDAARPSVHGLTDYRNPLPERPCKPPRA